MQSARPVCYAGFGTSGLFTGICDFLTAAPTLLFQECLEIIAGLIEVEQKLGTGFNVLGLFRENGEGELLCSAMEGKDSEKANIDSDFYSAFFVDSPGIGLCQKPLGS
jgi:hypothetical protein